MLKTQNLINNHVFLWSLRCNAHKSLFLKNNNIKFRIIGWYLLPLHRHRILDNGGILKNKYALCVPLFNAYIIFILFFERAKSFLLIISFGLKFCMCILDSCIALLNIYLFCDHLVLQTAVNSLINFAEQLVIVNGI